jgi:hypothetical protein
MKRISVVIAVILWLVWFEVETDTVVYTREPEEVLIRIEIDWTRERIQKEIETVAVEYGVSAHTMASVINCESQYNTTALGDGGKSRGLVQIHSGYHAVSDEDAYNPAFAIRFLAEHLKEGDGHLWTCYRKLVQL